LGAGHALAFELARKLRKAPKIIAQEISPHWPSLMVFIF